MTEWEGNGVRKPKEINCGPKRQYLKINNLIKIIKERTYENQITGKEEKTR